ALTGLPDLKQLEHLVQSANEGRAGYALLFIDVIALKSVNLERGRLIGDEVLRHVAHSVRATLRVADILFRHNSDEFVAFLSTTDLETANAVASRILQRLADNPLAVSPGEFLKVEVTVTATCPAQERQSLTELISAARRVSSATSANRGT